MVNNINVIVQVTESQPVIDTVEKKSDETAALRDQLLDKTENINAELTAEQAKVATENPNEATNAVTDKVDEALAQDATASQGTEDLDDAGKPDQAAINTKIQKAENMLNQISAKMEEDPLFKMMGMAVLLIAGMMMNMMGGPEKLMEGFSCEGKDHGTNEISSTNEEQQTNNSRESSSSSETQESSQSNSDKAPKDTAEFWENRIAFLKSLETATGDKVQDDSLNDELANINEQANYLSEVMQDPESKDFGKIDELTEALVTAEQELLAAAIAVTEADSELNNAEQAGILDQQENIQSSQEKALAYA